MSTTPTRRTSLSYYCPEYFPPLAFSGEDDNTSLDLDRGPDKYQGCLCSASYKVCELGPFREIYAWYALYR
jgi:hypothetical protein